MMNFKPVLTKISAVAAEEISWLWHPYLPLGKITMLDGLPGTGKTYFALALAAALSGGRPVFNEPAGEAAAVIYMTKEDGLADTIKPRLEKLGANGENILILKGSQERTGISSAKPGPADGEWERLQSGDSKDCRPFDLSQPEVLEEALEQVRPRLVIIDNITSFLGPKINMNKAQGIARLMNEISDLAQEFQCAFLIIRHPSKQIRDCAIHAGAGSYAFAGVARSMLLIGKDPEDPAISVMVHNKSNLSKRGRSVSFRITEEGMFEWGDYCDVTASELMAPDAVKDAISLGQKELAKVFLAALLENSPLPAAQVFLEAKKAGVREKTLRRAKDELGIKSVKTADDWFWVLPSENGSFGELP